MTLGGPGVYLEFAAALVVIALGGAQLCRYADRIARRTGLSGTWIGLTLLAIVTSLPELSTGLSAVTLADSADLAVGTILGSCVFNLMILALLDLQMRQTSLYASISRCHIRTATYGLVLIAIVALPIGAPRMMPAIGSAQVGLYAPIIVVIYVFGIRSIYRHEKREAALTRPQTADSSGESLPGLILGCSAFATVVVVAGLWLPFVGVRLAGQLQIQESFVGTVFLAFTTSAPEMVVAMAAVRIGAANMAASNILGSNLFNILILVPEDFAYRGGPLLSSVSSTHVLSALASMAMTMMVIVALSRPRAQRPGPRLGSVSWMLLLVYVVNTYLHFDRPV